MHQTAIHRKATSSHLCSEEGNRFWIDRPATVKNWTRKPVQQILQIRRQLQDQLLTKARAKQNVHHDRNPPGEYEGERTVDAVQKDEILERGEAARMDDQWRRKVFSRSSFRDRHARTKNWTKKFKNDLSTNSFINLQKNWRMLGCEAEECEPCTKNPCTMIRKPDAQRPTAIAWLFSTVLPTQFPGMDCVKVSLYVGTFRNTTTNHHGEQGGFFSIIRAENVGISSLVRVLNEQKELGYSGYFRVGTIEWSLAMTVFCIGIRTMIQEQLDEIQIGPIPTPARSVQGG
jgi:hypothetical protein